MRSVATWTHLGSIASASHDEAGGKKNTRRVAKITRKNSFVTRSCAAGEESAKVAANNASGEIREGTS